MSDGTMRIPAVFLVSLCWLMLLAAAPVFAVELSADVLLEPKGDEAIVGRIYVKGDKVRQETTIDRETEVTILRPDRQVTWTISPQAKTYIEMPYQPEDTGFDEWSEERESQSTLLGEETISGIPCKKYESVQEGEKVFYWISTRFPFPLRVEDSDFIMEYRNIQEGPVDESLFEAPAGYTRTAIPMSSGAEGLPGQ